MSLAQAGQILMTRPGFDNARQSLKGEEIEGIAGLKWHYLWQAAQGDELHTWTQPSMGCGLAVMPTVARLVDVATLPTFAPFFKRSSTTH
jgi:hypothetical protein